MKKTPSTLVLVCFAIAVGASTLTGVLAPEDLRFLWVLPLAWGGALLVVLAGVNRSGGVWSAGALMLAAVVSIRYLVVPVVIAVTGDGRSAAKETLHQEHYNTALMQMVFELFFAVVLFIAVRKLVVGTARAAPARSHGSGIAIWATVTAVMLSTLFVPEVRERFSLFTEEISMTARELVAGYDSEFNGFTYLGNLGRMMTPAIVVWWLARRSRVALGAVLVAATACFIPNIFYVATSRAAFAIPLIAAMIALSIAAPAYRKVVMTVMGVGLLIVFGVVSYWKSVVPTQVDSTWLTETLSIYFLGPREYAVGLAAVEQYSSTITGATLYNDLLANVPFASGSADLLDRTSQLYNWTYNPLVVGVGGGYIVPAATQGSFYLGPLFGVIAVAPAVIGLAIADGLVGRFDDSPTQGYVRAYCIVAFALYYANSVSALMNILFATILPLAVLAWLQSKQPPSSSLHVPRATVPRSSLTRSLT